MLKFYKDRIAINILAHDADNLIELNKIANGYMAVGIMAQHYAKIEDAIKVANEFKKYSAISVGLGDGSASQWERCLEIAKATNPDHVNQTYPTAGYAKGFLTATGYTGTIVNALVKPSDEIGKVVISTGPLSEKNIETLVDVSTAAAMIKEAKIDSVKFFPMHGTEKLDHMIAMAKAASKARIDIFEPTGGINEDNIEAIVKACLDAGCKKVMPHIYSSIVEKETGKTKSESVKKIFEILSKIV